MKPLFILPLLLCGFFISCATNNPLSRIEKHPARFEHLSENQKALAQEGRIEEGMHKDGVFIALGNPDSVTSTLENGSTYEDWKYYGLAPVYRQRFGISIGTGFGLHGRRGLRSRYYSPYGGFLGRRSGFLYSPSIDYVPRLNAVIRFEGDHVSGYKLNQSN